MGESFRLADWIVDPDLSQLRGAPGVVHIEPRSMAVLVHLSERAGEVESRDELLRAVWKGSVVTEEVLTHCIWELRKALGDQARKPRFIQTIPKRGYRLIAAVSRLDTEPGDARGDETCKAPYPGLAPFTEHEADLFFGREDAVEAVRGKLFRRRLLALIGPSGAGKTSFLRAGLLPTLPKGWRGVICEPGDDPFRSLAQALVTELESDAESLRRLFHFEELGTALFVLDRFRRRHREVLLVVDQFEELFTLCEGKVEEGFAELLGRAAAEKGVHVLLSLRDDFLFACHSHPALAPVFSEVTPMGPLSGEALRRALVEPATAFGYQFEDETLLEEMAAAVAGERGALPLIAFAAARLWESRDRHARLLTRSASQRLGGVSGALAQHAEATLDRIGPERRALVREIFRNLITAQGTRCSRRLEELLTVFDTAPADDHPDDREAAREVLAQLVSARLVTAYQAPGRGDGTTRDSQRVEIVHESLVSAWPRLARWHTQDVHGAQLRDQLRQASRLWEARGRPADLLWTGASLRELETWRENDPRRLTSAETAFVNATLEKAGQRRRRRRLALVAAFVLLLGTLATVGRLWWLAEGARQVALAAARDAEASRLVALGRLELERNPSSTLAHALASLELKDRPEARLLALEALWRGPTVIVDINGFNWAVAFSPDGKWLAQTGEAGVLRLQPREGGLPYRIRVPGVTKFPQVAFGSTSEVLVARTVPDQAVRMWSVPQGRPIRVLSLAGLTHFSLPVDASRVFTFTDEGGLTQVRSWPLGPGEATVLGSFDANHPLAVDATGTWLAWAEGRELYCRRLSEKTAGSRLVGRHDEQVSVITFVPGGRALASLDLAGEVRVWSLDPGSSGSTLLRTLASEPGTAQYSSLVFDRTGSLLATVGADRAVRLWDLTGPPGADPVALTRVKDLTMVLSLSLDPTGRWLATGYYTGVAIWPLVWPRARLLRGDGAKINALAFSSDGSWIASASLGAVRVWPVGITADGPGQALFDLGSDTPRSLAVDPGGRFLLAGFDSGEVRLLDVETGGIRELSGFEGGVWPVAFGPRGRLVAAAGGATRPEEAVVRVWDLISGRVRLLDAGHGQPHLSLAFTDDGHLAAAGEGGLQLWSLDDGSYQTLREGSVWAVAASGDGRFLLSAGGRLGVRGVAVVHDLETGRSRPLASHGDAVGPVALDSSGTLVVTAGFDGVVRVGPLTGEPPHLLFGHQAAVWSVAVDPSGHWIASGGEDGTLRIWPMPEGQPFHTLPHDEIRDRLQAFTNYRVIPDETVPTAYRLDATAFPGWQNIPTW